MTGPRLLIVLLLLQALWCVPGCVTWREAGPSDIQLFDKSQVRAYLAEHGLESDIGRHWQDASGRTIYIVGGKGPHNFLILLRADRDEPLVVDLSGTDLGCHWVDSEGAIRALPEFAVEHQRQGQYYTQIDDQSGLFLQYDWRDPEYPFFVGHMEHPEGWLFSGNGRGLEPSQICGKRDEIILFDGYKSIKVHGPFLASTYWVFSPDPTASGRYVKTDEFRLNAGAGSVDPSRPRFLCWAPPNGPSFVFDYAKHEQVGRVPAVEGQMRVFLDGDWLTPRLARVSVGHR